jgi:hypothetical protein
MTEETKSEVPEEAEANDNSDTHTEDAETSPIDEAKKILEETKKERVLIEAERKRIEKATAEMLVGGRTFAGQQKKVETEDEKWAREAKIRYAGTGMDPT